MSARLKAVPVDGHDGQLATLSEKDIQHIINVLGVGENMNLQKSSVYLIQSHSDNTQWFWSSWDSSGVPVQVANNVSEMLWHTLLWIFMVIDLLAIFIFFYNIPKSQYAKVINIYSKIVWNPSLRFNICYFVIQLLI